MSSKIQSNYSANLKDHLTILQLLSLSEHVEGSNKAAFLFFYEYYFFIYFVKIKWLCKVLEIEGFSCKFDVVMG